MNTQTPQQAFSIGFIGCGRVAATLAPAMAQAGFRVVALSSRRLGSAQTLAAQIADCRAYADAQSAADASDVVFLTVPDDAIEPVCASIAWRPDVAVLHCSGATELAVLDAARGRGAWIGSFHPFGAFTEAAIDLEQLADMIVAIEADDVLLPRLQHLASGMQMEAIELPQGARALYHLSGSFAASFISVLLREAQQIWQSFGLSPEQAMRALLPLAQGTLDSIVQQGLPKALTGPVSRGDAGTVARHLDALAAMPQTRSLYIALTARAIDMALQANKLEESQCRALRQLIDATNPR